MEITLNLVWQVSFVLLVLWQSIIPHRYMVLYKNSGEKKAVSHATSEKLIYGVCILIIRALPLVAMFTSWMTMWDLGLSQLMRGVSAFGLVLVLVAYQWTHKTLDRNWSPFLDIKKEQKLITSGPYRYARHPMYTCLWGWVIFQGLLADNWMVEVGGLILAFIFQAVRIPREEAMMRKEFGKQYEAFCKTRGRLTPWF